MRSIFPEIAYAEKDIDNVKVKILAGNYECKDAYLMTKWIKSAFDALDNSYVSLNNNNIYNYFIIYKITNHSTIKYTSDERACFGNFDT